MGKREILATLFVSLLGIGGAAVMQQGPLLFPGYDSVFFWFGVFIVGVALAGLLILMGVSSREIAVERDERAAREAKAKAEYEARNRPNRPDQQASSSKSPVIIEDGGSQSCSVQIGTINGGEGFGLLRTSEKTTDLDVKLGRWNRGGKGAKD